MLDLSTTEPQFDAVTFLGEMRSRNLGLVSEKTQNILSGLRVLIAGCGSVGGSVVEPLVRLGVGSLVLADPDRYELSNLNRQACVRADVGRLKVDVIAERAQAINPLLEITTIANGITSENVATALDEVCVVFDGIDSTPPSLWIKYRVHELAARARIPVLLGVDFGGKPVIYVWDYRRDPRPFYGKGDPVHFREGRELASLRSYLGVQNIPTDFLPVIRKKMVTGEPWPQVAYCAAAMGAIASRTVIDIAVGIHVRHVIGVDLHRLPRRGRDRLRGSARWPLEAARTLTGISSELARSNARSLTSRSAIPPVLQPILEAIRLAPSGHNAQPWQLSILDGNTLSVGWNRARSMPVVDPGARYACYSLGCAIESAATASEVIFEPTSDGSPLEPSWTAGILQVAKTGRGVDARSRALLGARCTNRAPFLRTKIPESAISSMRDAAERAACQATVFTGRDAIGVLANLTSEAARDQFSNRLFVDELLDWIRLAGDPAGGAGDGFTAATLRLSPPARAFIRVIKCSAASRRLAITGGLPRLMALSARRSLQACGAIIALSGPDTGAQSRVNSGRALLALWLSATRYGLAVQPVNFAVDAPSTRARLASFIDLDHADELVALLRVGYPTVPAMPAPRLPLKSLLTSPVYY